MSKRKTRIKPSFNVTRYLPLGIIMLFLSMPEDWRKTPPPIFPYDSKQNKSKLLYLNSDELQTVYFGTEKYANMQCTIHAFNTVQKLGVKQWTLHPQQPPYLWRSKSYDTNSFQMVVGGHDSPATVNVTTLYRCKLHVDTCYFMHHVRCSSNGILHN